MQGDLKKLRKKIQPQKGPYGRLLALAAHALAEVEFYRCEISLVYE